MCLGLRVGEEQLRCSQRPVTRGDKAENGTDRNQPLWPEFLLSQASASSMAYFHLLGAQRLICVNRANAAIPSPWRCWCGYPECPPARA